MKYLLLIPCMCLLLCCKNEQAPAPQTVVTDIFDRAQVNEAVRTNQNKASVADGYYRDGERQLRKEKKPAAAVGSFMSSLIVLPSARGYFELGNAYMDVKQYKDAIRAYGMAEALDYKPLSKLLYNTACAYSLNEDYSHASRYLEYAIESGYTNRRQIATDPDLKGLHDYSYDETYLEAMSGNADPATLLWNSFKNSFAALALPVTIDNATVKTIEGHTPLPSSYGKYVSEMQSRARFSRMGTPPVYPYAMVADNAAYTTVIYCFSEFYDEENSLPKQYWMVSYNGKGEQMDKMYIAGQGKEDISRICTINRDLTFQVKEFTNKYKKPLANHGYYNNPVVATTLRDTREYRIDESGHFIEAPARLGMR